MKVLIIGSSGGIGLATAEYFFKQGHEVIGVSKSEAEADFMTQYVADVRKDGELKAAVEKSGNFDALIYCAGVGLASPAAETAKKDYRDLFDVNFFGMAEAVKLALPKINAGGRIILISSVAGETPVPFNSFYCASKAAVNAYALSLSMELDGRGIKVIAVLPGGTKTKFTEKRVKYESADYGDLHNAIVNIGESEQNGAEPCEVAEFIYKAALNKNPRVIMPVGFKNGGKLLLNNILPEGITKKMTMNEFMGE